MWCCSRCFTSRHPVLRRFIQAQSTAKGPCPSCGAHQVCLLEPASLRPLFAPVVALYAPSDAGVTLAALLQRDFVVFSAEAVPQAEALLEAIVPQAMTTRWQERVPLAGTSEESRDIWERFARFLQHERRFLFDARQAGMEDPRQWLPLLLPRLEHALSGGSVFYRGRGGVHPLAEMGAPPPERAPAGRANPRGIPFLYLSTDETTVIAELRPWKGQALTLATFALCKPVRVVDLTQALAVESPFGHTDLEALVQRRTPYGLLEQVNQMLSHPIDPQQAELEYLPTQYLTEVMRQAGYDGLLFNSALGPGCNLVLFQPEQAEAISRKQVSVTHIHYHWHSPTEDALSAEYPSSEPLVSVERTAQNG